MEIQRDALLNVTKYAETRIRWPSDRSVIIRPGCVVILVAHGSNSKHGNPHKSKSK